MMPLHQYLELRLDIGSLGVSFKPKHVKGPPLGIEHLAPFGGRPLAAGLAGARPAEQAERILGRPAGTVARAFLRVGGRLPPIEPIFQVGRWPVMSSF